MSSMYETVSCRFGGHNRSRWIVPTLVSASVLVIAAFLGGRASPLILSGLIAILAVLALLGQPQFGLVLLVSAAYLVPVEIAASGFVSVNAVLMLLPVLFVVWGLQQLRTRGRSFYWSHTYVPLLVLLLVALAAWLVGNASWDAFFPQPGNLLLVQLGQWTIYALSAAAYILAAHQTLQGLRRMTATFLGIGVIALIGRYGGPFTALVGPWLKPFAVSNGSFFVWMTVLAAGQALFNQQITRPGRVALFVLSVAVPVLGFWQNTAWASSWLPSLLALIMMLWLRSRFVSVSVLAMLLVFFVASSAFLLQFYDWGKETTSIDGRFVLWESVLRLAMDRPILGLGLTTYHQYYQFIPLLTDAGRWWQPNVNSHNLYVDLFAQMGIVGLAVFGWIVFEIGRLGWRLRQRFSTGFEAGYVASVLTGLVAMLIASAMVEWLLPFVYNVGFTGFRFSVMNWVFLGGLVVLDKVAHKEKQELENEVIGKGLSSVRKGVQA